ncbi:MAG TPA: FadR/GntR family transcriptional regulator [Syntrophorhabdaceae bacterium]|nr:FadR/GntR family transcriptional regulator [Syntrophorhabdaceae bacterium]
MLKEVRKKRAYEDIVTQIRTLIEKGRLKHGDQLPNEKELSETFKVSRSTVREAILSLETQDLVERRQGDGTYVMATSEEAIVKPLAQSIFHEKDDIIDIFTLRKILEPEIAKLAAEHSTQKAIRDLEDIVNKQDKSLEGGKNPVKTDSNFHYALAQMSKNKVLERLLMALVRILRRTREEYLQSEERKRKSLAGHRAILAAIKTRNGTAAKQAMRRHLEEVEDAVFKQREGGETEV